jgi:dGTPase
MRRFNDRFDHNLHSLRIVEVVEQRYGRFPGLNLTFEVREGIAKHSRDFAPGEFPELEEYLPGLRPPLEAQIIDLADEIAYNSADLDDGFSACLFTMEQIVEEVPGYEDIYDAVETQFAGAAEQVRFLESVRRLIDRLATGLIEGSAAAVEAAEVQSVEEVRRYPERLIRFTPELQETNAALKQFLRKHVYYSAPLIDERRVSAANVARLFEFFLQNPELLPRNPAETGEPIHRAVCDYIAGMTDGYFGRVYENLVGQEPEPRVR